MRSEGALVATTLWTLTFSPDPCSFILSKPYVMGLFGWKRPRNL